jgi:hypothetical protein
MHEAAFFSRQLGLNMEVIMNKHRIAAPLAAVLALGFAASLSAQEQEGLINVNISNNEILEELNLSAPITVQAPIGIAANVCGVNANVLAEQRRNGDDTCDAQNSSQALQQLVNRQRAGG